ncbi:hypothetical protein SLEP1_g5268 [Rubroshorea leprosula]|uniref:FACT complex subunit n=1 Tax=Rubroshorea leprosula TaxID=152421 RepID=A0AAV5I181_9ROSI|nr:hypothetical protein SLEP1_g5268 [Rubroshorea leprosula]
MATPPASKDLRYLKSSALNIWLLGYEFPETIMVFAKRHIHFLCSQKKASLLEVVKKTAKEARGLDVVMHVKAKNEDGTTQMDTIFRAIHAQPKVDGNNAPVVGYIAREEPEGKLLETWAEKLKIASFHLTDVSNGLSDLFAVKDEHEILNVKKAAYLALNVMQNVVVPKLENVIDEEMEVTHSVLMDETEKAILEPFKAKVKFTAENVDICYPPIFQSRVGARYNSYCSNIARTLMINANSLQSKAYKVLHKAHEAALGALKPGDKISAAYQAALSVVEKDAPELVPNLTKSAGTGVGLEFRESGLNLNAKNDRVVKDGMVFNLSLGFQNIWCETKNPKNQNFSLLIADTVIVREENVEVLTAKSSKNVTDVTYFLNKNHEKVKRPKVKAEANGTDTFMSKTTLRSDNHEISKEELGRQHQAEPARQKDEETAR